MTEKERIAERIRALLRKTVGSGCTEAEALAAAELAGKLMDKYQLSMSDIELQGEETAHDHVKTGRKELGAMDIVAGAVGRYCGVKTWYSDDDGTVERHFFGLRVDVDLARWLYAMIGAAMRHDWLTYSFQAMVGTHRRDNDRRRFERGFADRVASRLDAMRRDRQEESRSAGRDLVVVKNAVVEAAFNALGFHLVDGEPIRPTTANNAYAAGVAAGDRAPLARPVAGCRPLMINAPRNGV